MAVPGFHDSANAPEPGMAAGFTFTGSVEPGESSIYSGV